jgi:hypothetical protein
VQVLFYPVPDTNPTLPIANPFALRAWDVRANLPQTVIGTEQNLRARYTGVLPGPGFLPYSGTPAQWNGAIDYDTWFAGAYSNNCESGIPPVAVTSVQCVDGSLNISPITGVVICAINTGHTNVWSVQQLFEASGGSACMQLTNNSPTSSAIPLIECRILGINPCFSVYVDGRVETFAQVQAEMDASPYGNGLVVTFSSVVQFAVGATGEIQTNQTSPAYALGNLVATMPVFDAAGTLVGAAPLYQTVSPAPAIIARDDFAGVGSTDLASHTMPVGAGWTNVAGGIHLTGQMLAQGTASTFDWYTTPLADSDFTASCSVGNYTTSGGQIGFTFRGQDTSNYLVLFYSPPNLMALYQIVATVSTLLEQWEVPDTLPFRITVACSGPSITISTPNSIFVGSVTTFETDVIFGIYCLSDPNGGMWWNLLVTHP